MFGGDRRGLRAAADGGYWHFYRDPRGLAVVRAELYGLTDGATSAEEGAMLKAEIKHKLQAAMKGDLRFGEKEDVSGIWREPDLCELRLGHTSFDGSEPAGYKHRLYFAEPPQEQRLLLGLKFARKRANEAGLDEQNEHIDCASDRYVEGLPRKWGIG
jgi:hypothetical protein